MKSINFFKKRSSTTNVDAGILSDQKITDAFMLWFGVIFALLPTPAILAIPSELEKGNVLILAVLVFPLFGGFFIRKGFIGRSTYKLIGPTPMFLDPSPGCVGGQVGAKFALAHGHWLEPPKIRLSCVHIYRTGSGKNSTTHHDVVWQEYVRGWNNPNEGAGDMRFVFDVPSELPVSGQGYKKRGRVDWQVHCDGQVVVKRQSNPGNAVQAYAKDKQEHVVKFERTWTIPVSTGTALTTLDIAAEHLASSRLMKQREAEATAIENIKIGHLAGDLTLESRWGRHFINGLVFFVCGVVFAIAGGFLFREALAGEAMLWLMAPIFFFIGLASLIYSIFYIGRGLDVAIGVSRVRMVRTFFGKALYRREGVLTSPSQITLKLGVTSTTNTGVKTEYYALVVTDGTKTIKIAEAIPGRDAAEALRQIVIEHIQAPLEHELR